MIILGIETSCDETAIAIIETRTQGGRFECRVIESLIHSQAELHSSYGGVFPSLAKREHSKNLIPLLEKAISKCDVRTSLDGHIFEAKKTEFSTRYGEQNPDLLQSFLHADFLANIPKIDAIAVTEGPGLEPALWVGITFAKILGQLWDIPVIPVNHMEGHIVGSLLESDKAGGDWQKLKDIELPGIAFLLSGGHTELVAVEKNQTNPQTESEKSFSMNYKIIGQTRDDAVGEAFDKVARLLGLPYPGGPNISRLADIARKNNISSSVKLPRPMINSKDLDFSFSGLKTAVLYAVKKAEESGSFTDEYKQGLALEFEESVSEVLNSKLKTAINEYEAHAIIIGGGVSANTLLRETFTNTAKEFDIPIFLPSKHISGDNALMIALAGAMNTNANRDIRADGTKKL